MTLTAKRSENGKGWQYRFVIEFKDKSEMDITFSSEEVSVDDKVYKVSGYKADDFLYLFE